MVRNVPVDHTAGCNHHITSNGYTRQNLNPASKPDVVTHGDGIGVLQPGIVGDIMATNEGKKFEEVSSNLEVSATVASAVAV